MASPNYILGRKKYSRPQAMLWAENPGSVQIIDAGLETEEQFYVPDGYEIDSDNTGLTSDALLNQFIILSDDNRSPIDFSTTRIEKRERMINGRMRSYHIADKINISVSWDMLPSRSYADLANFNQTTGKPTLPINNGIGNDQQFTTDGGAGGVDLLNWYENHTGSFWVYLAYDKHNVYGSSTEAFKQLAKYNQVVEMYISDFSYSVVKRGANNHDLWNVQVSLEEV
jgi:hypothetical protein